MIAIDSLSLNPNYPLLSLKVLEGEVLLLRMTQQSIDLFNLYALGVLQDVRINAKEILVLPAQSLADDLYLNELLDIFAKEASLSRRLLHIKLKDILRYYDDSNMLNYHKLVEFSVKEKERLVSYLLLISEYPNIVFNNLEALLERSESKLKESIKHLSLQGSALLILTENIMLDKFMELKEYDII